MSIKNKIPILNAALLVSSAALLMLITAGRTSALVGCAVTIVLAFAFLWKNPITLEKLRTLLRFRYVMAGLLFCIALGDEFYLRRIKETSYLARRISEMVGMDQTKLVFIVAIFGIIAATPVVSVIISYFINAAVQDFKAKREEDLLQGNDKKRISMGKALIIMFIVFTVGISAILRANVNYVDDRYRTLWGYKGWDNFSRLLSNTLSTYIHCGNFLTDVSPLPQLIAVLFLSISGILILYILNERTFFSHTELIALIILGLNPFFMECISYKYDAPYMALSILSMVIPLLYWKSKNIVYIFISIICAIATCTTYQAALGVYPMLVILLAFKMWGNMDHFKNVTRFCLRSIVGYGAGLIFFKIIIMVSTPNIDYVSPYLPNAHQFISNLISNFKKYYGVIKTDFKPLWIFFTFILAIGFLYTAVQFSKQKKYISVFVAAVSLVLMALLCFGVYPAFSATLFEPRAMYGFGVMLALWGIFIVSHNEKIILKTSVVVMSWMFFVFSFTYGNALYAQKEYYEYRCAILLEDLIDIDIFQSDEQVNLQCVGDVGLSLAVSHMVSNNNKMVEPLIIERFNPMFDALSLNEDLIWRYSLKNTIVDRSVDLTTYDLPVIKDTVYHTIKGRDNNILVELKPYYT